MNWSDERYVRLFTRDTATWLSWRWETRAVLSLMLRKVDRSGVLEVGRMEKHRALALVLMMPSEVVSVALDELVACGTAELTNTAVVLPNFLAAQEAVISDAARQRESRERRRASVLANHGNNESACHAVSRGVTGSHAVSQPVTPAVPTRAVPSVPPQQLHVEDKPRPAVRVVDPKALTDDERDVWECWRAECRHPKAVLTGERLKLIRRWLPVYGVERLQRAIVGCSKSPHHQGQNDRHTRYDSLELILRDAKHIEMFEGMARGAA